MAEEPILFNVSDNGTTEAFIALLKQLASVVSETFTTATEELGRYEQGSAAAAAAQELMNTYIAAGGSNIEAVGDLLSSLTARQIEAAGSSAEFAAALQSLGVEEQAAAIRASEAAEAAAVLAKAIADAATAAGDAATVDNLYARTLAAVATEEEVVTAEVTRSVEAIKLQQSAAVSATSALKGVSGGLTSLTSSLGFYLSAAVIIKADDTWQKVQQQLQLAVGAGNDITGVYTKLAAGANAAQLPIQQVATTFGAFAAAGKEAGVSLDVAADATNNFAALIARSGVTTATAARLMHDFTEEIATNGNASQALNSILRQSPQFVAAYNQVMGTNVGVNKEATDKVGALTQRLTDLRNQYDGTAMSVGAAREEVKTATTQITEHQKAITKADTTLKTYNDTHGESTKATNKDITAWETNTAAIAKNQQQLAKGNRDLAIANQQRKDDLDVQIKRTKAELDNAEASQNNFDIQKLGSAETAAAIAKLPPVYTTVSGALTVFNNKLVDYVGTSGEANVAIALTTKVLGGLADLLPVIVPAVIALGAAFAGLKIVNLVGEIANLGGALVAAIVGNPAIAIILGLAAVFGAIAYQAGLFDGALKTLHDTFLGTTKATVDSKKSLDDQNAAFQNNVTSVVGLNTNVNNFALVTLPKATAAVQDHTKQSTGYWQTYTTDVANLFNSLINTVSGWLDSFFAGISAEVASAVQKLASLAGFGGGGGAPASAGAGGIGAAREGATVQAFARGGTIGGSGGVDSKLIAVSPGEHVTIQTPEQFYAGKVNNSPPGQKAFASGGVTGFSMLTDTDYYTSGAAPASSAALTSSSSTSSASSANSAMNDNNSNVFISRNVFGSGPNSVEDKTAEKNDQDYANAAKAYSDKLLADRKAISDAGKVTAVDGVSKPSGSVQSAVPINVIGKWSVINNQWVPNPGASPGIKTYAGNASQAFLAYLRDADNPPKNANYARDGLDYTVPGGSGTDSRLLQLAVSPGERVQVKTPQQQMQEDTAVSGKRGGGSGRTTVQMTVYTKDANSFGQSQSQLLDAAKRKLARA